MHGHSKHPLPPTQEMTTLGHHQMVNTEIRLIIFFAVKDGKALYHQQKQDLELTATQILNSSLKNSNLLKKVGKTSRPFSEVKSLSRVQLFATPWTVAHQASLLHAWDFPGKSAGVDCHFLLQGILPTQELNPGL